MKEYEVSQFEVLSQDDFFVISLGNNNKLLRIPSGEIVKSKNESFIKNMLEEFNQFSFIEIENSCARSEEQLSTVSSYNLYCGMNEFVKNKPCPDNEDVFSTLLNDALLYSSSGPEVTDQLNAWKPISLYLEHIGIASGEKVLFSGINPEEQEFCLNFYPEDQHIIKFKQFANIIYKQWEITTDSERIVLQTLTHLFDSMLSALCFINKKCTKDQFVKSILAAEPEYAYIISQDITEPEADDSELFSAYSEAFEENYKVIDTCEKFMSYFKPAH